MQLSCPFLPTPASRGTYPQLQVDGVVMATAVKCEGDLHGSCWNSPVMSFSCSIRGPCCGSVLLLICLCIPPSRTAEAARASAPFNLRPAPRSPRGSHGRTCWANSSFPFVHTRKLTDLIRWLLSLWWRLCHVTRISYHR